MQLIAIMLLSFNKIIQHKHKASQLNLKLIINGAQRQTTRLFSHIPVMASEVVEMLQPEDNKVYIDMTFGFGGHSKKLLSSNKSITIVAVDRDPVAIEHANKLAKQVAIKSAELNINQRVIPVHGKFSNVINKIRLKGIEYGSVDGVLFDLGASSIQYDDENRGFSISAANSALDMRMDTSDSSALTAEDVVNNLDVTALKDIFKVYGQEKKAIKIANAIMDARVLMGRVKTTQELAGIVHTCKGAGFDSLGRHAHPATKVFQALRIFVNNELNELDYVLGKIVKFLKLHDNTLKSGRAVALTFHSLEDKIVKKHFNNADPNQPDFLSITQHDRIQTNYQTRENKQDDDYNNNLSKAEAGSWKPINKHVLKPQNDEILTNPRARSAKLRAAARYK